MITGNLKSVTLLTTISFYSHDNLKILGKWNQKFVIISRCISYWVLSQIKGPFEITTDRFETTTDRAPFFTPAHIISSVVKQSKMSAVICNELKAAWIIFENSKINVIYTLLYYNILTRISVLSSHCDTKSHSSIAPEILPINQRT